jgi:hypothetical protein
MTRIVNENVNFSERGLRRVHNGLNLRGISHIAAKGQNLDAEFPYFLSGLYAPFLFSRAQHHNTRLAPASAKPSAIWRPNPVELPAIATPPDRSKKVTQAFPLGGWLRH